MTSQGPGLEILERLAEWSSEEIKNNIDHVLRELLGYLTGEDKGLVLQSVYALLVTCLPSLSVEDADDFLLQHAIPAAQLLFQESLEGIKLRLNDRSETDCGDISETLSSLLQVCIEILKCMESVLHYLISQGNINISSVPSVPKFVASLMLQTFKHCKESEILYQDVFTAVADVLGTMFRQCHQLQCQFFVLVTSIISFDCSVETDILYLVDLLQILSEMGEHIMSLDIKTMAEQWKGYAKLVQMYLEPLRQRLNVAYPINYLCVGIENNLEQLSYQISLKDAKSISRLLKTTSFILKIVVKLCEQFGSGNCCLGDCHANLFQLLMALYRNSPTALMIQAYEKNIIDDIDRHLIVAADPLLSHLICDVDFREEFFRKSGKVCESSGDHLPHLLLTLSVIKKIILDKGDSRDFWCGDEKMNNIVGCLLEILKFCHYELSCESWLPAVVKPGEIPRNCDLYEALCCHCAGLVLSLNSDQFQRIESMFLDCLLEPFIWPALLSGDVWCICARVGSSELVMDQVLFLVEVVSLIEPSCISGRAECKFIVLFLQRMCSFLSSKGKQILIDKFPPSDYPLVWHFLGLAFLSKEIQHSVSQILVTYAVVNVKDFLCSNHSVPLYKNMMQSLYGLCAALEAGLPKMSSHDTQLNFVVQGIISLWAHVCKGDISEHLSTSNQFVAGSQWLCKLFGVLCRCIENLLHFMNNKEILLILSQLDGVISDCYTSVKLSVSEILHGLATKRLETVPGQDLVCSKIAKLFASILKDSNPLVKECALETFEYFAHFTTHECIVAEAVADNKSIQDIVTSYLQKETPVVEGKVKILSYEAYFMFQGSIPCTHKCEFKKLRSLSPNTVEKPSKKMKFDCDDSSDLSAFLADDLLNEFVEKDVTDAVMRISKDTLYLISRTPFQALSISHRSDLKKAVDELNKYVSL